MDAETFNSKDKTLVKGIELSDAQHEDGDKINSKKDDIQRSEGPEINDIENPKKDKEEDCCDKCCESCFECRCCTVSCCKIFWGAFFGRLWDCFGIVLVPFWNSFGDFWGPFGNFWGIVWGSVWDHVLKIPCIKNPMY